MNYSKLGIDKEGFISHVQTYFWLGVKFYGTAIKIPLILILLQPCVHTTVGGKKIYSYQSRWGVGVTSGSDCAAHVDLSSAYAI